MLHGQAFLDFTPFLGSLLQLTFEIHNDPLGFAFSLSFDCPCLPSKPVHLVLALAKLILKILHSSDVKTEIVLQRLDLCRVRIMSFERANMQFTKVVRNCSSNTDLSPCSTSLGEKSLNELPRWDPLATEVSRQCALVAVTASSELVDRSLQHRKDIPKCISKRPALRG